MSAVALTSAFRILWVRRHHRTQRSATRAQIRKSVAALRLHREVA